MMTHGVRMDCCLINNAYFVYWRSHSARNEPHPWRWLFDNNPNYFQVVAQPNSRTYDASGGQTASVLASIWFCKDIDQDHFITTTSDRWPTLENDVWETHWALFNWSLSTLLALLCLTGTRTFCTVPVDSNFSTRCSIVDLQGRLFRP